MGSRAEATETHAVRSKAADNFQTEHDKFLEDFEKPTVIYRLIRNTSRLNPRFLYRNLTYMKNRISRTKKSLEKFKLDDMLGRVKARKDLEEKSKARTILTKNVTEFINVIVLGFCDGQTWATNTDAKVEIQVIRIFRSRRKESELTLNKSYSASCKIAIKAQTEESLYKDFSISIPKGEYPVLPIPKDAFNIVNGHIVQSIRLAVRVAIPVTKLVSKNDTATKQDLLNGNENVDFEKSCKNGATTTANGRASLPGVSLRKTNGNGAAADLPNEEKDAKSKRQRSMPTKDRENFVYEEKHTSKNGKAVNDSVVYIGVLTIYDRENKINIPDEGNSDLEIRLNRQDGKKTISQKRARRESSWEISLPPDHSRVQEYLLRNGSIGYPAKIALAFRTSTERLPDFVTKIDPIKPALPAIRDQDDKDETMTVRVVYYFIRGTGPRQSTECRNDLRCPWCSINCLVLYSLLKHLDVCHPRFKFTFSRINNGARVDVSINDSFDGSYTGSAYDLVAQPPGQAFGRDVPPGKRTQLFSMLAFRPKRMKREQYSVQEFFDNEDKNTDQNRSYMIGHNRLYHHTTTCLPIHPREIDVDSEGEPDPEWLRVKTCMMIDEFTDVNEGEKEIMKMWNHHVMHENYVGDCQISLACTRFVDRYGHKIIEKNLYRNFVLHITNLYDFGLLPAQGFHATVQRLHGQMKDNNSAGSLKQSWGSSRVNASSTSTPTSSLSTPSPTNTSSNGNDEPMDIDGMSSASVNGSNSNRNGL